MSGNADEAPIVGKLEGFTPGTNGVEEATGRAWAVPGGATGGATFMGTGTAVATGGAL